MVGFVREMWREADERAARPTDELIARTLAYEEWPFAEDDDRTGWANRNWKKYLRHARMIQKLFP